MIVSKHTADEGHDCLGAIVLDEVYERQVVNKSIRPYYIKSDVHTPVSSGGDAMAIEEW